MLRGGVFNGARNFLADDRAHGGSQKTEIHHRDRDLVAVENAMPADHCIDQARALLILFEAILIRRHTLKSQHIHGRQVGVHLYKTVSDRADSGFAPWPAARGDSRSADRHVRFCASSISGTTWPQPGHF